MEKMIIYQKPSCSTCKEVYQILKDSGVDPDSVDYYVTPVPKAKLRELAGKMGMPVSGLIRDKEQVYQDLRLGEKTLTDEQLLDLIAIYPDLLQRPIIEQGERAILAKPARKIKAFLASLAPEQAVVNAADLLPPAGES
jgi:arsenate reductase